MMRGCFVVLHIGAAEQLVQDKGDHFLAMQKYLSTDNESHSVDLAVLLSISLAEAAAILHLIVRSIILSFFLDIAIFAIIEYAGFILRTHNDHGRVAKSGKSS